MRLLRAVQYLSLNWDILILYIFSFHRNVVHVTFRNNLRNITSDMLNCIVVSGNNLSWHNINTNYISVISDRSFSGNNRIPGLINVIVYFLLYRNIFDSWLSFNHLSFNSLFEMRCSWWGRNCSRWNYASHFLLSKRLINCWLNSFSIFWSWNWLCSIGGIVW